MEQKLIDSRGMEREVAILIYKGKIYEDENHQYALEVALKENGEAFNFNVDEDIDEVAEITHEMSKNAIIYTYDIFTDGIVNYLVSHFEDNLYKSLELIKEYALKKQLIIGTFVDFRSSKFKLIKKY